MPFGLDSPQPNGLAKMVLSHKGPIPKLRGFMQTKLSNSMQGLLMEIALHIVVM